MAGVSECFAIGSIVACKTCYNKVIEGEVQAFDPQTKMLVLKCPASNNRPSCSNVYIVNLSLVSDVQVKKEVTTPPEPTKPLNLQRISNRVRTNIEQKRCLIAAIRAGVTQEGMMLFNTISKTINEVTWQGPNIVVMNQVTITPPYTPDNIKGDIHSKAFIHIRKVVEKHLRDTQLNTLRQQQTSSQQQQEAGG
uniref:Putative anticodon-binding domain protein n=1 Tax=Rhodnius prolixus TaxID=13249 RepID=R4FLG4_RHOPR